MRCIQDKDPLTIKQRIDLEEQTISAIRYARAFPLCELEWLSDISSEWEPVIRAQPLPLLLNMQKHYRVKL